MLCPKIFNFSSRYKCALNTFKMKWKGKYMRSKPIYSLNDAIKIINCRQLWLLPCSMLKLKAF